LTSQPPLAWLRLACFVRGFFYNMSRPKKNSVDYFPHQCSHGATMFILEQKYGNNGYAFWFKLLELLGKTENHYLDINDISKWQYIQAYVKLDENVCREILNLLSDLKAIDPELYETGIIWSDNFLAGISDVYRNRTAEIPVKPDFLRKKPPRERITSVSYPQSKVKDIKEEETKEEKEHAIQKFIEINCQRVATLKKQMTFKEAERIEELYGYELAKNTLLQMENFKPLTSKYTSVTLTLNNWCKNGKKNNLQSEVVKYPGNFFNK